MAEKEIWRKIPLPELEGAYAAGDWTLKALAERFGVSKSNIGRIITGETWRHLLPEAAE